MLRAQGLCEGRGGRAGLPDPNSPYGLCGRKATLNSNKALIRAQELCEQGGRSGLLSLIDLMASVDVKQSFKKTKLCTNMANLSFSHMSPASLQSASADLSVSLMARRIESKSESYCHVGVLLLQC